MMGLKKGGCIEGLNGIFYFLHNNEKKPKSFDFGFFKATIFRY